MSFNEQVFAQAFARAYKAVSSTPNATYGHGPGGTFSPQGLDKYVFNAMILPHLGLQSRLPVRTVNDINPLYGILTGVTAVTGDDPTGECDDPPTAGLAKLCTHSAVFGRYSLQTRVFDIEHAGERTNRGEFLDLQLIGNPLLEAGSGVPTVPGQANADNALRQESAKALFELGASYSRKYAPQLYTGNPSNNTAGNGYMEPYGLETLINTGYRDAITGDACAAADSIVESFGNNNITDADADIVGKIQDIFFRLRHIASRAGLGTVNWVMAMPLGMFYRLSEVWAYYEISRALDGLTFNATFNVDVDGAEVTKRINEYRGNLSTRQGQFLMVDGQRIDVILDDAITETEVTPGQFEADIYIIPLTVMGGTPVTYMEYFNYDRPGGSMELARVMAPGDSYYTTDGGMYIWHKKPPTNLCVQLAVWSRPRTILRTPYIAARITNVLWAPLTVHERSPFTDSSYFVNGGRTDYAGYGPSFYSPTS